MSITYILLTIIGFAFFSGARILVGGVSKIIPYYFTAITLAAILLKL